MAFRFQCPKCNTASFSIERDSRSYAPRGQPHELIFSCRCGKQMFGPQIDKEYDRQKAQYEANPENKPAAPTPATATKRDEQLRKAYAHQAAYQARKRKDAENAAQVKKDDDDRKWRDRVSLGGAPASKPSTARKSSGLPDGAGEKVGSQGCGWHTCDNPPRPNSKYCSRDCSNKNARARYKRRKAADKAA